MFASLQNAYNPYRPQNQVDVCGLYNWLFLLVLGLSGSQCEWPGAVSDDVL